MSHPVKSLYEFEGFRLSPSERLLQRNGVLVPLSAKSFDLLLVLVRNSGRLLSKRELMESVWADAVVEDNNLDKTISALRKALGEDSAERKLIETVRGHGYRFNAPVTELVTDQSEGTTRIVSTDSGEPADQSMLLLPAEPQETDLTLPSTAVEQRVAQSASKSWLRKSALGVGALLLVAVAVTLRVLPSKDGLADSPHGIKVARLTNGGYIHHAVISPDGRYFAATEQDGAAVRLWLRQVAGGPPVMLVREIKGRVYGLTFARNGEALYFVTSDQSRPRGALYRVGLLGGAVAEILTGIASPVAFAVDGQRIAFIRVDGEGEKQSTSLVVADSKGTNERTVLTRGGAERLGPSGVAWSPDGSEIACQLMSGKETSENIWRVIGVNSQSGAQRMLTEQQWDACGRIAWTLDGRGLVIVGTRQGEGVTTSRDSVWFVSQPDGAIRRLTADLNRHIYVSVSVTDDGRSLLVIPFNRTSQIWSVEGRVQGEETRYDLEPPVQLTSGTGDGRAGIASLKDGRVVYVARTGERVDLWRMNYDGSNQQQLTTEPPYLEEVSAPVDGSFLVFASNRAGYSHIFRVNRDGTELRQLTSGESIEIDSDCSPDGRWIIYTSRSGASGKIADFKLWKIPAEGGTPISLTDHAVETPRFSPDGRWISCIYPDERGVRRVAVIPADGGTPFKVFDVPYAAELNVGCRWTPDAQALTYIVKGKTFDNLWEQPLAGGAARALTGFSSGEIYNYAFARDGRRLFLARGYSIRDVALISNFR